MMGTLKIAAGLATSLVLLAACATPAPPGRVVTCSQDALDKARLPGGPTLQAQLPGTFTPIPLNQVTMIDPGMTRWLMVQAVGAAPTETNTVEVMTRLVNCTNETVEIEGRTHFLAANQAPTEPVSAWQRIYIPGRSIGVYQEKSISAGRVNSYLIELRQGR